MLDLNGVKEGGIAAARQLANLLKATIQLAATADPDALREALASVFDVSAIEEYMKTMQDQMLQVSKTVQTLRSETRALIDAIHKDVEQLEQRIDTITYAIEELELRRKENEY